MKTNKIQLTKEEQQILKDVEAGKYVAVENLSDVLKIDQVVATNTIAKNKTITIKLNQVDLLKIKAKAIKNGMPYQTMISTILHQFSTGKIQIAL